MRKLYNLLKEDTENLLPYSNETRYWSFMHKSKFYWQNRPFVHDKLWGCVIVIAYYN